jgi:hypothetical protein
MNWLIWCLFGNDLDGVDGDPGWQADNASKWWFKIVWLRRVVWWARNPFHNLCFKVLGVQDEHPTWVGRFDTVFADDLESTQGAVWNWGWTVATSHKYPGITYCGWLGRNAFGWLKGGAFRFRPSFRVTAIVIAFLVAVHYS